MAEGAGPGVGGQGARREERGERARGIEKHRDFLEAFRCSSRQHPAGGRDRIVRGGRAVEQRVQPEPLSLSLSLSLPALAPCSIRK